MKHIVIILSILSFLVLIVSSFYYFNFISDVRQVSYPASVVLSRDVNGFDINGTALTFGSIVPLGSSRRQILVTNPYPYPILVSGEVSGSIKQLFSHIPVTVIPSFNETHIPLSVSAAIDSNLSFGSYNGTVVFTLRRAPKNSG